MNTFKCPNCGKDIEVSEAFRHQLEEQILSAMQEKHKKEILEAKSDGERKGLERAKEATEIELKSLKKGYEEEQDRNKKLIDQIETLTDEMRSLRRRDEEREMDKKKWLADNEIKIKDFAKDQAREESKFEIAELKQKLDAVSKVNDELKKKLDQGSQQTQGEVLELDLEEKLKTAFIFDVITPVGKGTEGGDVIQTVRNQAGKIAGKILWETKRAKWTHSWLAKLREDERKVGAGISVLVSVELPDNIKSFGSVEGVLVSSSLYALPLATILRKSIMQIASAKYTAENKDEKLEFLYKYLQSEDFRHRFEAFAEGVVEMQSDLETEKRSTERVWKKREMQINKSLTNVSRLYGELQGIIPSLPEIKILSLPEKIEEKNKEQV